MTYRVVTNVFIDSQWVGRVGNRLMGDSYWNQLIRKSDNRLLITEIEIINSSRNAGRSE